MKANKITQIEECEVLPEVTISEDGYQEDSIENAIEVLRVLEYKPMALIKGDFQDDIWTFIINEAEFRLNINFEKIENKSIKNSIKCWATNLLLDRRPSTVSQHVERLTRVIKETNIFNLSKVDELDEIIMSFPVYERGKMIATSRSYLEYINRSVLEIKHTEEYLNMIDAIRNKYTETRNVRDLPPYKDILRFAFILEEYMEKCSGKDRLKYMPLLLWWKITAIIPLRINEFCSIKRNCIVPQEEEPLLCLPRQKQRGTIDTLAIDDKVPISHQIDDLISEYIELSKWYGETKTLISRAAYEATNKRKTPPRSAVSNRFNSKAFIVLLKDFYNEIISGRLKLTVVEKRELENTAIIKDSNESNQISNQIVMIQPNDTRHIAMCSMMLQGFDQLTIARMAGHKHIKSQYSYQTHLEYFAESKAYELTLLNLSSNLAGTKSYYSTLAVQDEVNKSLKSMNNAEYLEEVEFGYCTDRQMRCESTECILCSKNWIPKEIIEKNFNEIMERKYSIQKRLKNRVGTLDRIYKEMEIEILKQRCDPRDREDIAREAKLINADINDFAMLQSKIFQTEGDD